MWNALKENYSHMGPEGSGGRTTMGSGRSTTQVQGDNDNRTTTVSPALQKFQHAAAEADVKKQFVDQIMHITEEKERATNAVHESESRDSGGRGGSTRDHSRSEAGEDTRLSQLKLPGFDERWVGTGDQGSEDEDAEDGYDQQFAELLKQAKDAAAEEEKERLRTTTSRLHNSSTRMWGTSRATEHDRGSSKSPPRTPELAEKIPAVDPAQADTQEGTPRKTPDATSVNPTPRVDDEELDDDMENLPRASLLDAEADHVLIEERAAQKIFQLQQLHVHNTGIANIMATPNAPQPMTPEAARKVAERVRHKVLRYYESKSENSDTQTFQEKMTMQRNIKRLRDDYTTDIDKRD